MEMILELQSRSVYGTQRIYPMNKTSRQLAHLLQRKTLTSADLVILLDMGFKIVWIPSFVEMPEIADKTRTEIP